MHANQYAASQSDDRHRPWILPANGADALGPGKTPTHQASRRQLARSIWSLYYINRDASAALVTIVAAEVDPLQSIWRPHPAPATVVGGVGEGHANERKAMEAVMVAEEGMVAVEREA